MDTALIASERVGSDDPGIMCKLATEKAYDHVFM